MENKRVSIDGDVETIKQYYNLPEEEIKDLLEMAMAGTLDGVSAETIELELERRDQNS